MDTTVMLGHGSGGTMMKRIIDEVFFAAYAGDELLRGDDAAVLPALGEGERLAFSTDSFVVTPHFFPGGDIGRLAVCGTVNDVATSGARPLYLSCGFILEEGFPIEDLKRICASMAEVAREAGVRELPISLSFTHTEAVACAMAITEESVAATERRRDPMEELTRQFKDARALLDDLPGALAAG